MNRHIAVFGAAAVSVAVAVWGPIAVAQGPGYELGIGDLMTAFVQPRHTKLGLAAREQNWDYAAFALDELKETFEKVSSAVPKLRNFSIPEMIASTVKQPIEALERAVTARDASAFDTAYGQLTAACNACHESTGHSVIVIQAPTALAFPNQDFRPPRK